MIFAVLATGPSMSQSIADSVRGRCKVVAVSDSYKLAPWADALAATDYAWWRTHRDAQKFAGKKFAIFPQFHQMDGIESISADTSTNSGLLGMMVAVKLGATRVLLCGFDLHSPGKHFFGLHPAPLTSTPPARMEVFKYQFSRYHPPGIEIINCTPGSSLRCYPRGKLSDCLESQD